MRLPAQLAADTGTAMSGAFIVVAISAHSSAWIILLAIVLNIASVTMRQLTD